MKIATILASSQASKSIMLYDTVKRYASDSEIINFGCYENEAYRFTVSYNIILLEACELAKIVAIFI